MTAPRRSIRRVPLPSHRAGLLRAGVAIALALGVVSMPGTGGGGPALGSCATTPDVAEAVLLGEVVFVGSVVHLENAGRWATVRVEERWRGARALPDTVQVRGGPGPGTATSVDRVYAATRYLFVVRNGPGHLEDDGCTATTPWVADLARLRPPEVVPAADVVSGAPMTQIDWDQVLPAVALVAALVIAVVAYVVILRARRRPPDWFR
jgi:hypothetical protein